VDDDRRTWDNRYADQLAPPPGPPLGLVGLLGVVPAGGSALDVACGLGSTTVWAARSGFDALGLDVSPVAVQRAEELAERLGVGDRARFEVHDLDGGLPEATADGPYGLIICQRFRQPDLYPELPVRLAPGGVLVVTVLSVVGAKGRPGPHHAPEGELARAFPDLEVLRATEGAGEATVVARHPG
jgi:SAM-dependent methyltransferase